MPHRNYWLWIILLAYTVGFLLFPRDVLLINDEERYVAQAVAFAAGRTTLPTLDPASVTNPPSDFPPGTSLLQTPFVLTGGWAAAAGLSTASVILLVLLTRRLLREYGFDPAFGYLTLAYPGTLFFGRIAMSDAPAAALVALGLWLLKRSEREGSWTAIAAGIATSTCLLFREPVVLLTTPMVLCVITRRPRAMTFLAIGLALGVSARLGLSHVLFGDAFYIRDPGYGFSLQSVGENLPLYATLLLIALPFGAILPIAYRGPDRPWLTTALSAYIALFLAYEYNPWRDSGLARGTLLGSRFILPALPLLALMAADVGAREYQRIAAKWPLYSGRSLQMAYGLLALSAFIVHPLSKTFEAAPRTAMHAIRSHVRDSVPTVFNAKVVGKYLSPAYGYRLQVPRSAINPAELGGLCQRHGTVRLILLDRTDTDVFRKDAGENTEFVQAASRIVRLRLVHSGSLDADLRLKVYEAITCEQP